ncbi:MAG TPA: glycosyltransferase family A protein [Nocardioidaceae bacterium]|nr:glycosyltransferase family A protein [Nocardioidaceae bacterium]
MAKVPSVSVYVPCHNYGRFLRQCVESLVNQRGVDVRVLIIDDASTDDSAAVAKQLADEYSCVEIRVHDTNVGHIATYNEGIEWADGDYVVLLSADDLLVPGALQRATSVLESHPEVGLVYGRCTPFRADPPLDLCAPSDSTVHVLPGREWFELVCRDGENFIAAPEAVVRTSLQHEIGGYATDLPHSGDLEMWLRCAVHADVAQVRGFHALKRAHGESMQEARFHEPLDALRQRQLAFDRALQHYERRYDDVADLRALVYQALARDALWSIVALVRRRKATPARCSALLRYATGLHAAVVEEGGRSSTKAVPAVWLGTAFAVGTRRWLHGYRVGRRKARLERERLSRGPAATAPTAGHASAVVSD